MVFLHKNNFIHCLLNPSHILLSAQYYPLVSGFWYSNICDIKEYILKEKKDNGSEKVALNVTYAIAREVKTD